MHEGQTPSKLVFIHPPEKCNHRPRCAHTATKERLQTRTLLLSVDYGTPVRSYTHGMLCSWNAAPASYSPLRIQVRHYCMYIRCT